MSCFVAYCTRPGNDPESSEGLCKKHLHRWKKDHEPAGEALKAWLQIQSDLELDVCPTPAALALEICDRLARMIEPTPTHILEPSAGDGAFVRAIRATWPDAEIAAIEIQEKNRSKLLTAGANHVITGDLVAFNGTGPEQVDLIVGNPPFAVAEEHIRYLLSHMQEDAVLAFLLRVGFYGSKERLPFWSEHPERCFVPITPRPGFKLNKDGKPGTDSQEYGLFVWQKGWTGAPTRLPHIIWENGKRRGGGKRKKEEAPELDAPELE